jgi:integrase
MLAKDGTTTWKVRFRHNDRETSESFHTEKAASIFCQDIAARGVAYAVSMREVEDRERLGKTLDEALDAFLDWKSARVRSDRTIKDYRRRYELAIKPTLGHRTLASLTEDDITSWLDDLVTGRAGGHVVIEKDETGRGRRRSVAMAPKTIADRHALLHSVVKYALGKKWLESDPCAASELPKRYRKPPKGLRPAEWQALYAALAQLDPDAADLAAFLLATGWRWGEATALTTYDVEDDGARMWVTVTQVMRRGASGRTRPVEDAKSQAGERRLRLDPEAAAMVRRRVGATRPGSLVFTTRNGAPWHHSHFRSRAWEPAVDVANLARRPTPHWLRHTHVGWMVLAGASLPELQSRIGHASIKTTIDVYGRMVTDVREEALGAFAAMRSQNAPTQIGQAEPPGANP